MYVCVYAHRQRGSLCLAAHREGESDTHNICVHEYIYIYIYSASEDFSVSSLREWVDQLVQMINLTVILASISPPAVIDPPAISGSSYFMKPQIKFSETPIVNPDTPINFYDTLHQLEWNPTSTGMKLFVNFSETLNHFLCKSQSIFMQP